MVIEYFGGQEILDAVERFIRNFNAPGQKHALLVVGSAGMGKTHLCKYVAQLYKVELIYINASDKRTQSSVASIVGTVNQKGEKILVLLDECEIMSKANLDKIIKATKVPLFLCCNYHDMIDKEVINQCHVIKMEKPPWWVFKQYMESLMVKYNLPVPANIDAIAKRAGSFRHAERLVDDPEDEAPATMETPRMQVERMLRGDNVEYPMLSPDNLIHWINDNADAPDAIARTDVLLERAYRDDYHQWAYAAALLKTVRSNAKVDFPKSFMWMKQIKDNIENKKKQDRNNEVTDVKVDLSKVNVTAIKTGESLFTGLDDIDLDKLI